jgi:teichuronic acid biosynthesis protein TuaE
VVGGLRHLDQPADVGDGLALGDQVLCRSLLRRSLRLELADDLLGCVPGAFHDRVPGPVWPDEDSHLPWIDCQGPRHYHYLSATNAHLFLWLLFSPCTRQGHASGLCSCRNTVKVRHGLHSLMKAITGLVVLGAALGSGLSYGYFYSFHLFVAIYLCLVLFGVVRIRKTALSEIAPLLLFVAYAIVTLFWSPNYDNGLKQVFYYLCGCLVILVVTNYAKDEICLYWLLHLSLYLVALHALFGIAEIALGFHNPLGASHSAETSFGQRIAYGFAGNPNNFGFILAIFSPFFFGHPSRLTRILSILVCGLLSFIIQSKGFAVSILFSFALTAILSASVANSRKNSYQLISPKLVSQAASVIILIAIITTVITMTQNTRIGGTVSQISRGWELLSQSNMRAQKDSTGIRAMMYSYGIEQFYQHPLGGLGVAGVSSKLATTDIWLTDKNVVSFHNFFLELLIDYGLFVFASISYLYFRLFVSLYNNSRRIASQRLAFYARGCAIALIVAIPSSLSPSSIVYILSFWLLLGLSIATNTLCNSFPGVNQI